MKPNNLFTYTEVIPIESIAVSNDGAEIAFALPMADYTTREDRDTQEFRSTALSKNETPDTPTKDSPKSDSISKPEPGSAEEAELLQRLEWLIRSKVNKLKGPNTTRDDRDQIGRMAALVAIRKYEPEKGSIFEFAAPTVYGAILDAIKRIDPMIRIPDSFHNKTEIGAIEQAQRDLAANRLPATPQAISAATDIPPERVEVYIQMLSHGFTVRSLDRPTEIEKKSRYKQWSQWEEIKVTNVHAGPPIDFVDAICEEIVSVEYMRIINETLKNEPELETLIQMKFGLPPYEREHSISEICQELGLSPATCSRRYRYARELLRTALGDQE